MRILVVGASGGSGMAAVLHALAAGHEVTGFSRQISASSVRSPRFRALDGDATDAEAVNNAVCGHDAVIVTLGIHESPFRVRLYGPTASSLSVRSVGTQNVIAAMRTHEVRRLVVQTTYGLADTRSRMRWMDQLFFALALKPQLDDTEVQRAAAMASGLDWVEVQPVRLTNDPQDTMPFHSTSGEVGQWKVSRASVGRFLVHAATSVELVGCTVAVSGP